jgi:hypothetical protein
LFELVQRPFEEFCHIIEGIFQKFALVLSVKDFSILRLLERSPVSGTRHEGEGLIDKPTEVLTPFIVSAAFLIALVISRKASCIFGNFDKSALTAELTCRHLLMVGLEQPRIRCEVKHRKAQMGAQDIG